MILFHPSCFFSTRPQRGLAIGVDLRAAAEMDWKLAPIRDVFQVCAACAAATLLLGTNRYSGVGTQPAFQAGLGLVVYVAIGASITPNGKGQVEI